MGMRSALNTAPVQLPAARVLNKPWENVGDFWNDPHRWDGIVDPHKEPFWMKPPADAVEVRPTYPWAIVDCKFAFIETGAPTAHRPLWIATGNCI